VNPSRYQSIVCLIVVWVISAALVVSRIDRGWIPHDEGTIGHSAERVLAGELPHRDFDDVYTGGLAYVNAGAMRMFGIHLRSPRILLVGAPDAPDVYFLSGRRNPTRTLYDLFDDLTLRTARVLSALREKDVRVVAINTGLEFSNVVSDDLRAALEREYPRAESVGGFEVRWRE
jgi:hypothetical protein